MSDRIERRVRDDDAFAGRTQPADTYRGFKQAFGFGDTTPYPYANVASHHRRGRFYGRGPKNYQRSDARIREEICDRLMTHPDIDASDLDVAVANGIAVLTGTVEDRHEKRLAEYIAEDSAGVDDVDNRLRVRHGFWSSITGDRAIDREIPSPAQEQADVRDSG